MDLKINFTMSSMPQNNKLKPVDENHVYETIIIGGGPAGLTAAVYSLRKGMDTALITFDVGGQVLDTSDIENYMGFKMISGQELINKFFEQVKQFPLAFEDNVYVTKIEKEEKLFKIYTTSRKIYKSLTVIIAAGKRYKKLNVEGEDRLTGHGVAYCATCDAPLFKGKEVIVVGGGNTAIEGAIEVAKHAEKVFIVLRRDVFRADKVLVDKLGNYKNIEILFKTRVKKIIGKDRVEYVLLDKNGEEINMKIDGIFIEVGMVPNSEFVKDFVKLNQWNEIIVDSSCKTSKDGCFAAGDITSVPEKQIIISAGEGAKAAVSAFKYVMEHDLNIEKV